jgi:hypothetical protein
MVIGNISIILKHQQNIMIPTTCSHNNKHAQHLTVLHILLTLLHTYKHAVLHNHCVKHLEHIGEHRLCCLLQLALEQMSLILGDLVNDIRDGGILHQRRAQTQPVQLILHLQLHVLNHTVGQEIGPTARAEVVAEHLIVSRRGAVANEYRVDLLHEATSLQLEGQPLLQQHVVALAVGGQATEVLAVLRRVVDGLAG